MLKLLLLVGLYYPLSVGLTFYQKWFISNVLRFPLLIVAGHYMTKWLLAVVIRFASECIQRKRRVRVPLSEQLKWLMPVGVCASLDIGLSNWALEYITISLYTMGKSSSVLFIVAFSLLLKLERWRFSLGVGTSFIAVGLALFTWRSTQLDLRGLFLVELAALCTGVRWTISQLIMQTGVHDQQHTSPSPLRHPLDMVIHVQPWMLLAITPMVAVVEGTELSWDALTHYTAEFPPHFVAALIIVGGVLAFLMEMSEYLLLVNTSGITLSILGIVKEVITLLLAHRINDDRLSTVNLVGLSLCIVGMVIHSVSKQNSRKKVPTRMTSSALTPLIAVEREEDRKALLVSGGGSGSDHCLL